MDKRCIHSENAPPAAGPYSHAVASGGLLFLSGQVPLKPDGSGLVRDSFEAEVRQVFANIEAVLGDCGVTLDHVVKVTAYLADMDKFGELNTIYAEYFSGNEPARTCFEVGKLPLGVSVEIEVIATQS